MNCPLNIPYKSNYITLLLQNNLNCENEANKPYSINTCQLNTQQQEDNKEILIISDN